MVEASQGKAFLEYTGLWNVFESKEATPKQAHDLLNFRSIGQEAFEGYVSEKLLALPSTAAPTRRKRLCTFSTCFQAQKQRTPSELNKKPCLVAK